MNKLRLLSETQQVFENRFSADCTDDTNFSLANLFFSASSATSVVQKAFVKYSSETHQVFEDRSSADCTDCTDDTDFCNGHRLANHGEHGERRDFLEVFSGFFAVQKLFANYLVGAIFLLVMMVACAPTDLPANQQTNQTNQPTTQPANNQANPAPTVSNYEGTILAFGDSLTAGLGVEEQMAYPAQLERKLQEEGYNYRVINGGISGETSSAALNRLDWMSQTDPDIVIIETGGNDALRGVDLSLTEQNIEEIVTRFENDDVIIVFAGLQIIQNLGEDYINQFAEMYPRIAANHPDAIFIPFFLEGVAADPELNQPDFIHPTAEGYTVVVDHIFPFVEEAIQRHKARAE